MCAAPAHHGASPRAGLAVLQAYQVAWDVPCGSSRQDLATVERAVVRNASVRLHLQQRALKNRPTWNGSRSTRIDPSSFPGGQG